MIGMIDNDWVDIKSTCKRQRIEYIFSSSILRISLLLLQRSSLYSPSQLDYYRRTTKSHSFSPREGHADQTFRRLDFCQLTYSKHTNVRLYTKSFKKILRIHILKNTPLPISHPPISHRYFQFSHFQFSPLNFLHVVFPP